MRWLAQRLEALEALLGYVLMVSGLAMVSLSLALSVGGAVMLALALARRRA